jgi:hypothetical protein
MLVASTFSSGYGPTTRSLLCSGTKIDMFALFSLI